MTVINPPLWQQDGTYTGESDRRTFGAVVASSGRCGPNDLLVTAGSGLSVSVAAGTAFVKGVATADQGYYLVTNDAPLSLALAVASATNPRIDAIVVSVTDKAYGDATSSSAIGVLTGAPSSNPVAPAPAGNAVVIATVLVPTNATTPGTITMRPSAAPRILPPAPDVQTFTTSGTWKKPAGAVSVLVEVWGGGGGGSGSSGSQWGSGGGGGACNRAVFDAATLGATEIVTVGSGGAGAGAANGATGGSSTFHGVTGYPGGGGWFASGLYSFAGGGGGVGGAPDGKSGGPSAPGGASVGNQSQGSVLGGGGGSGITDGTLGGSSVFGGGGGGSGATISGGQKVDGGSSIYGGGGGGGNSAGHGGGSVYGGSGGNATSATPTAGGGGGGYADGANALGSVGGAGGAGGVKITTFYTMLDPSNVIGPHF